MNLTSPSARKPWREQQQTSYTARSKQYGGATFNREQEYPRINCAFHPEEKITNFCKNFECLLPMCPRCVKIHTEEHMKNGSHRSNVGTHGDFEIIGECFKFLEEELSGVMRSSKAISQQTHQLINERKQRVSTPITQLNDVKTSYQQAKKKLLEELQRIFQDYEVELEERLQVEEITFSQDILAIEDSICLLIGNARKSVESLYSAYALEHLIQFYSHDMFSFEDSVSKCQQQLQNFDRKPLDLQQDNTQLLNVRQCIRKFFDSGEELSKNLAMATFNKMQSPRKEFDTRSQVVQGLNRSTNRKMFGEGDTLKEPSVRMASVKNSELTPPSKDATLKFGGLAGRLANSSHLKTFQTPLDSFDLGRPRDRGRDSLNTPY